MAENSSTAYVSDCSSSSGNQGTDSVHVLESSTSESSNGCSSACHTHIDTFLAESQSVAAAEPETPGPNADYNDNSNTHKEADSTGSSDNNNASNGAGGFAGKPRRSSILKSGKPKVKKSVSFCSMPEDRRVSNGE